MNRFFWPLIAFIVLVVFLAVGLNRDPREIPSPLVGKPAPAFSLPRLDADADFSPKEMLGRVWLLNVWASWCESCKQEHSLLLEITKAAPLVGINYKEIRGNAAIDYQKLSRGAEEKLAREYAQNWLKRHGDPYSLSVLDIDGRVSIDYGVYGVPETYVIDKNGVIRHKHIGPITRNALAEKIFPLIAELSR